MRGDGRDCSLLFDLLQDTELESPILAKRNRLNVLLQVSNTMPIIFADLFPVLFAFYTACRGMEGGSGGGGAMSGTTPPCSNQ